MAAALLTRCICCSLLTGSVLFGVSSLILYLISLAVEIWFIVETKDRLPVPAYVLLLAYACMSMLSTGLIVGLRIQRCRLLLAWILLSALLICPESGMVLFMAIYHWKISMEGTIELVLWIVRTLVNVSGIICTQSLYAEWKDEDSIMKSLSNLNVANSNFLSLANLGEYQKHQMPFDSLGSYPSAVYQNSGFQASSPNILSAPTTIPTISHRDLGLPAGGHRHLQRSVSSVSHSNVPYNSSSYPGAASVALNNHSLALLHQAVSTQTILGPSKRSHRYSGLKRNEFDTSKFSLNLISPQGGDDPDGGFFGLDLDAPVFVTGPYREGGLMPKSALHRARGQIRPLSSASFAGPGRRPPPEYHHFTMDNQDFDENQLQWYKPRNSVPQELSDDQSFADSSSLWSSEAEAKGCPQSGNPPMAPVWNPLHSTQSLDRGRHANFKDNLKWLSTNALNYKNHFDSNEEGGIVRGGVGPMVYYSSYGAKPMSTSSQVEAAMESQQSLGQASVDKYKDVAL